MMLVIVPPATAHHQRRNQWRGGACDGVESGDAEDPCTIVSRLFTFVIGLVVVGAALVIAIRVALSEEPATVKPATPMARRGRDDVSEAGEPEAKGGHRPPRAPAAAPVRVDVADLDTPSVWRRVRSGVLLLLLVTALGALTALTLVVTAAVVLTGLRNAVQ